MASDLLREAPTNRSQSPFLFTAKGQEGEGATFLFDNKWKSYLFVPNLQQNHESCKLLDPSIQGNVTGKRMLVLAAQVEYEKTSLLDRCHTLLQQQKDTTP